MNNKKKLFLLIILLIISAGLGSFIYFSSPVNSQASDVKYIKVNENESVVDVLTTLEDSELIRSKSFARLYIKFTSQDSFKAGLYEFKQSDRLSHIVQILNEGSNSQVYQVTFREGLRVIDYAQIVEETLDIEQKDFLALCNDKKFIDALADKYELIKKYKFDKDAFYLLEGLFAPDTYQFQVGVDAKEVIDVLIKQNNKLYLENKELFDKSKLSLNEIFTLASIVEGEAQTQEDRELISSIYLNRIEQKIPLGADITTYYGLQLKLGERDLTNAELNEENGYNTRAANMLGLPVGPVNSPNFATVKAVLSHKETDYLYYVSDKNFKIYPAKTYEEHNRIIEDLKEKDLWLTY